MEKYYFCKEISDEAPELSGVAFPTPAMAVYTFLLYGHPTFKHMCKLTPRPPSNAYVLTTARPHEVVEFMLCETQTVTEVGGKKVYGDDNTKVDANCGLTVRELLEYHRLPICIERH